MKLKLMLVILTTSIYPILRYVVFGNVSLSQVPIFLLNKSVSMAAVLCLFFASLSYLRNQKELSKYWVMVSIHCAYIHIIMSLAILSKAYYPKFYNLEKMNIPGELTILFGILGAYFYWFLRKQSVYRMLASLCIVLHLVLMGITSWLNIEKWPGLLPPISLISCILVLASFVIYLKGRNNRDLSI